MRGVREYMSMPEVVMRAMEADIAATVVSPGIRSDIESILLRKHTTLIIKRSYDIVFSFLGLVALLPVFIIIAIAIKIDSPGPIFYTQSRVGKDGKNFKIYKFRKMHEFVGNRGSKLTLAHDQRMTRVGSFLRKTKLDELPQAWNVLKGDMAVVGPRPETPNFVKHYSREQRDVLKVRPGITDYASIYFMDEGAILERVADPETYYIETIMPKKINMSRSYIRDMTLVNDFEDNLPDFQQHLDRLR